MGHSLGGLIVLDYVLRSAQSTDFKNLDILGMVVSAPPIQPTQGTGESCSNYFGSLAVGSFPSVHLENGVG